MNITFLVGNGFDISCGVDTSYSAFYKWYCTQPSDKEHIARLKQEIKDDIKNGRNNWADFEIGLGRYTSNFTIDTVNDFFECYEDARDMIIKFLEKQKSQYNLKNITSDILLSFAKGMLEFYSELSPKEVRTFDEMFKDDRSYNTKIKFLSFNYSDILDLLVLQASKTPLKQWDYNGQRLKFLIDSQIIHMHGTSTWYPVLGVNDESQIANKDLLNVRAFKEIMIKPYSVTSLGELWHSDAEAAIANSKIICIFGMSLGATDSKWWNNIIRWLKGNSSHHLIIYWYTKNHTNPISIYKRIIEENNARQALYSHYNLSPNDIENIRSRIHVVLNSKKVLNVAFQAYPTPIAN